jgi:NAD(P)-dependent dehydrogenase (short-subunit alcohol dehydrogenase family)
MSEVGLLENKIGMVTGGGNGIGRATCLKFAAEGARVLVVDINEDDGMKTVELIREAGGEAEYAQANVANEDDVSNAIAAAVNAFGALHVASNNAALSVGGHLLADMDAADFAKTYDVTVNGVFYCMKYQIPAMIESGGGAIVNIGSRAADQPNMMMSAYDSAKAAVNGLTRSAAKEYAQQGVRVNCVNPGVIRTEGIDQYLASNPKHEPRFVRGISMKRLGSPDELAEAVTWLCSDRASYITGHSLNVDGGMLS